MDIFHWPTVAATAAVMAGWTAIAGSYSLADLVFIAALFTVLSIIEWWRLNGDSEESE